MSSSATPNCRLQMSRIPVLVNRPTLNKKEENTKEPYNPSRNKGVKINNPKATQLQKTLNVKTTNSKLVSQVKQHKISESNKSSLCKNLSTKPKKFPVETNSKQTKLKPIPKVTVNNTILEKNSVCNAEEKENKLPGYLAAQKDIKFEAHEEFRKMLLSERALSPNVFKYGHKLSVSCERPSIYKKLQVPNVPYDPVKALSDARFSIKRDQKSISMKQVSASKCVQQSPMQERFSFYTPGIDPKEEVLKSLTALKEKRKLRSLMKNTKKVSFNSVVEKFSPQADNPDDTLAQPAESNLTNICEQSEENTPNSSSKKTKELVSTEHDTKNIWDKGSSKFYTPQPISFNSESKSTDFSSTEIIKASDRKMPEEFAPISTNDMWDKVSAKVSTTRLISFDSESRSTDLSSTEFKNATDRKVLKEFAPISTNNNWDKGSSVEIFTPQPISSSYDSKSANFSSPELKNATGREIPKKFDPISTHKTWDKSSAKIFTPRPISFNFESRSTDFLSPEFINGTDRKMLKQFAPINTPLVLKGMADSVLSPDKDLSPVRLKLEFTDDDKESPRKEAQPKHCGSLPLDKIVTYQSLLDDLADKECNKWLLNKHPVLYGRYLQNPVALTLSEGDEMHFVPIKFLY